jgi:hypothetical protein
MMFLKSISPRSSLLIIKGGLLLARMKTRGTNQDREEQHQDQGENPEQFNLKENLQAKKCLLFHQRVLDRTIEKLIKLMPHFAHREAPKKI